MPNKSILLIVLCIIFFNISLFSQNADSLQRPKIGLVLSGGGAKGLAHIGVLKVLEEVGIKPDYITGTSMGSIIGGLYSLGYNASELSEINANANWSKLLSDNISLNKIVMEEKYESKRYVLRFPIRNYEFKLPSGLIEGQQLLKFFSNLTWAYPSQNSFDNMPIPFHCMSVDLISGETITHSSGNITKAMKASMSIPSIFAPESIDSLLLVDGGITQNFPANEVRKMGADIIIGVYVGFKETVSKEDLFSLSDVLSRATILGGMNKTKEQLKNVDFLIIPDLEGYSSSSFSKSKQIELLGEEAARKYYPQLKKLADSLNLQYTPIKRINQPEKIFISDIEIKNTRFIKKDFVIGQSGLIKNTNITKEELFGAIDKIYGTQYFKKVSYNLEQKEDKTYKLNFILKEKTRAFLNFGLRYDNRLGAGAKINLTLRNYLIPSSHVIFTANLAENPAIHFEVNKYLGKNQKLINSYFLNWNNDQLPFYSNGFDMGTYDRAFMNVGIDLKYSITLNQQIGIKAYYEYNKIMPHENLKTFLSEPNFDYYKTTAYGYSPFYSLNNTDDLYFPTKGSNLNIQYRYLYNPKVSSSDADNQILNNNNLNPNQDSYSNLHLNYIYFTTFFNKLTFNIGANIGINSDEAGLYNYFILGGTDLDQRKSYIPFSGLNFGELVVKNFASLHTGLNIKIYPKIFLSFKGNIAFNTESANDMYSFVKNSPLNSYLKGYMGGVKINSPIGPIQIMIGDNDFDDNVRWYFSIGYPF
ncbi:MAG: patatin-like phospholipase family protein [Bacteroidales bacterium]|jgi:NTE family protein|nr:patatin-like phospholipase family protein [Bacteroidales bacterium]